MGLLGGLEQQRADGGSYILLASVSCDDLMQYQHHNRTALQSYYVVNVMAVLDVCAEI